MSELDNVDRMDLEDVNIVLRLLGIKLVGVNVGPKRKVYCAVDAKGRHAILIRWANSNFCTYGFDSPGEFLQEVLREDGIVEFNDPFVLKNGLMANQLCGKSIEEVFIRCDLEFGSHGREGREEDGQ